jgi:hypothetical protein
VSLSTFTIALSIYGHAVEIRTENTDHDASVLQIVESGDPGWIPGASSKGRVV